MLELQVGETGAVQPHLRHQTFELVLEDRSQGKLVRSDGWETQECRITKQGLCEPPGLPAVRVEDYIHYGSSTLAEDDNGRVCDTYHSESEALSTASWQYDSSPVATVERLADFGSDLGIWRCMCTVPAA